MKTRSATLTASDYVKECGLRINYSLLETFKRIRENYSFEQINKMRERQLKKHSCYPPVIHDSISCPVCNGKPTRLVNTETELLVLSCANCNGNGYISKSKDLI